MDEKNTGGRQGGGKEGYTEENLQEALLSLQILKEELENLSRQQAITLEAMEEHQQAIETLKVLKEEAERGEGEEETLVPIGAGSFLFARVDPGRNVIVNIGSGISVEKPLDEAIETLEKRKSDLENANSRLLTRVEEIERQMVALDRYAREAYVHLQRESDTGGTGG